MNTDKRNSYTAASQFPIKVLLDTDLINVIDSTDRIIPIHVQLYVTNRCNLKCTFCSYSKCDKQIELSLNKTKDIIKSISNLGCKAITLSGGGEPLMHPNINEIIAHANFVYNIDIGLVTNGLLLELLKTPTLTHLTWCRISFSDERTFDDNFIKVVTDAVNRGNMVDWAFSYVVSSKPDYNKIKQIIELANSLNFTHVRLVSDLLDLDKGADMNIIKTVMESLNVDDKIVIYQGRKEYTHGTKQCLISLLKPVIDATGNVTACCGVQFKDKVPSLNYGRDNTDIMGTYKDLPTIINKQQCYDGSKCHRCYYAEYNELLGILKAGIDHKKFV